MSCNEHYIAQFNKENDPDHVCFRELAENADDVIILRSGIRVIYVNPAFERVFGHDREALHNDFMSILNWIFEADRERILSIFQSEDYNKNFQFDEQYRVVKSDGSIVWIWHRSTPVFNSQGELFRMADVATDITEIKNLEENHRKSKFQQQAILDNIPHLAWLKDKDGYFISANKSFCNFFNQKPEDITGKTDFDFCPPNLAEDYANKDKMVLKEGKAKSFYEIEAGTFGKRFSETIKSPVFDENGEIIGIAGISRDITEQKLAEKALLSSEEKFKDLVTLLPEIVFETDEYGRITYVNLKAFDGYGFLPSDIDRGVTVFDIIAPEDLERAKENFSMAKAGEEFDGNEYTILSADKRRVQVMVFTNNMYSEGKWMGLRGVAIDITRKKMAEEQGKQYQSRLLFLSQTALDFLEMTHSDNIFKYIGIKIKELIKTGDVIVSRFDEETSQLVIEYLSANDEIKGRLNNLLFQWNPDYKLIIHDEQIEIIKEHSEHFYEFRDGIYEAVLSTLPRNVCDEIESLLHINRICGMSMMRSGKLYGVVLILKELEDENDAKLLETFIYQASIALHRRQLETELIHAKEKAEETDMLKTTFLANMSHEIRTPMNGILGLVQMLHNPRLTEHDKSEYISLISTNGKILLNLVNDIIDISRIESNQVDLSENIFSIDQLFGDLEQFFRSEKMVKKKDHIQFRISNELLIKDTLVLGDLQKIRQILTNLISNAIKFTYEGEIEVGCRLNEDNQLLFFVRDTGIGIPPEQQELVFSRFTQVDQSLTRPFGGSGLGLAICKGFVDKMGGKIWVNSTINNGSVFYFSLPWKPVKKPVENIVEKQEIKDYDWNNLCVLVVEDNFASFKLLQLSLKKTGISVLHADNGLKAVELVEQNAAIDLVLMDIQLPLMNGFEATKKIKAIRPELHVIAQTANATDENRLRCIESGCSDYLTKPINLDRLHKVINDYLLHNHKP